MENNKYNVNDLIKFINEDKSTEEIGVYYNVSGRTIRNWFKKEGLESNVKTRGHLNVINLSIENRVENTKKLVLFNKEKIKDRISCICEICKNEYKIKKSIIGTRFCSNKCKYVYLFKTSPENHPRWLGGKSRENQIGRGSQEYYNWRLSVWKRDFFTCKKCDKKGKDLNAHHINNWADFTELRFSIDNGVTLCKTCHKELHKLYGQKTNEIHLFNFLSV